MRREVVKSKSVVSDEWRVEEIDDATGDCYVTLFSGPLAEVRAREYASWRDDRPERVGESEQEQCSYCQAWFPRPVGLHHAEDECVKREEA